MTQMHSAASLGPEEKRLVVMEKARAQEVWTGGANVPAFLQMGTPQRQRVLGIC